ncbi:MAG: hypothetical protein U1F60_15225 [Planctomycetota bacterium]
MDPLRAMSSVNGSVRVGERQGGGQKQAERFRQALQQEADGRGEAAAGESGGAAQRALRTGLQPRAADDRKDPQQGRHVDVFA